MASADLREELTCSVCLSLYSDPVTLTCGHNFCRSCIGDILERQRSNGVYSCPDCRAEFQVRPVLQRNITLCNIAERFASDQAEQSVTCTYCDSPAPAMRSCLRCETSMCESHLRKHDQAVDHVLVPPLGHVSRVQEVSLLHDKKRHNVKMKRILQKLTEKREKTDRRLQNLKDLRKSIQEKAEGQRQKVATVFMDLRRRIDDLEVRVLCQICSREEQDSNKLSDLIRQLEIKTDELYSKILYMEELCETSRPLPASQQDMEQFSDAEEADEDVLTFENSDLNKNIISETLHMGLNAIMSTVGGWFKIQMCPKLLLDLDTAGNSLILSEDLKTVSWTEIDQKRPETPKRFQYYQVLSSTRFTSGQHSWEVETSKTGRWRVGVAYSAMERKGGQSFLGSNKKSWCLRWCDDRLSVMHDCKITHLPHTFSSHRLRLTLDYEAGKLSFYELCDPIRHLHTFTATFTGPLHAAFCVWTGSMRIFS